MRLFVPLIFVLAACGDDDRPATSDGGMDAAAPDAGPPDAGPPDTGPPDAGRWIGPGCNPDGGVQCDGDWEDKCGGACTADECCTPQHGRFVCLGRGDGGSCPAPDLWVDEPRLSASLTVEWKYFAEDDCAIVEGCVAASGWRRLLRFDTWTPNTGGADMYLGPPTGEEPYFVYSACHDHHHFESYAAYELLASDGTVAAEGHKQAFCLLDYYQYPGTDDTGSVYDCDNQGIQAGWQDVYGADLDCQWVDVTDLAPGDYSLHISLNNESLLLESDYDNNSATVPVTIPEDVDPDVTLDCPVARFGQDRSCGLVREGMHTCTAGAMVTVGCSAACSLGSCTGDTVIRACEPAHDPTCTARHALASNDDAACGSDGCSQITFTCPAGGEYVVFWGAYDTMESATCTVATNP